MSGSQSKTERADYAFRLVEKTDGKGWQLMLEPRDNRLEAFGNGTLFIEFDNKVSRAEASEIREKLSMSVETFSFVSFSEQ